MQRRDNADDMSTLLIAVELATSIEARLDIRISAPALSGGPTLMSIIERLLRLL